MNPTDCLQLARLDGEDHTVYRCLDCGFLFSPPEGLAGGKNVQPAAAPINSEEAKRRLASVAAVRLAAGRWPRHGLGPVGSRPLVGRDGTDVAVAVSKSSEAGFTGFEDFRDFRPSGESGQSEAGFAGFEDCQDFRSSGESGQSEAGFAGFEDCQDFRPSG